MSEDRSICCGDIIPEGRQICWSCEHQSDAYHCVICGKEISKPKFSFGGRENGKTMVTLNYNARQACCSDECFSEFIYTIQNDKKGYKK